MDQVRAHKYHIVMKVALETHKTQGIKSPSPSQIAYNWKQTMDFNQIWYRIICPGVISVVLLHSISPKSRMPKDIALMLLGPANISHMC